MDKQLARSLLDVFDTPKHVEDFEAYLDFLIAREFTVLKSKTDVPEIYRIQGRISALEMLKGLRERAIDVISGA